jgi:flagellar motility protein MotE (MotC chaperone)
MMNKLLQAPWMTTLLGCILYLGTTAALIDPADFRRALDQTGIRPNAFAQRPSWEFRNPEFEQWVAEVNREREALALRKQQLQELESRLAAEREELKTITDSVLRIQEEFDRNVVRLKDQEIENLKRQSKVLAGMSPEGAAGLIGQMPDGEAVGILFVMKTDEASAILDSMSKLGAAQAKHAASLTEQMRRALPPEPAKTRPTS